MNTYARIVGGVAVEVIQLPDGVTPAQAFVAALAATFVPCDLTIGQGWTYAGGVFAAPVAAPPTQVALAAYANIKQWGLATGGFTVTIASTACTFNTDDVSTGLITGKAVRLSQLSPPATINWQFVSGYVLITATEFIAAATQIADFVQATFDSLESVLASIASGAITTTAQVDAAAWPSNVSAVPIS